MNPSNDQSLKIDPKNIKIITNKSFDIDEPHDFVVTAIDRLDKGLKLQAKFL